MRSIHGRADGCSALLAPTGLAVAALLLALPPGCSRALPDPIPAAHGDEATAVRGGTLRLATIYDLRGLDPAGPTDGLVARARAPDVRRASPTTTTTRALVPELADHWDVEDEGRAYRYVLRPGVTMHDGTELTADDVKRSVERALHPATPNQFASYFAGVRGYEAYAAGKAPHVEGVTVEGRYVVVFRLDKPDATFPYLIALHAVRPVCKSGGDRYADTWQPCGAGPFRLEPGGWQPGTSLRLVRHAGYFRPDRPYLDAVEWTFNMQEPAQRLHFDRGEIDMGRDVARRRPTWRGSRPTRDGGATAPSRPT